MMRRCVPAGRPERSLRSWRRLDNDPRQLRTPAIEEAVAAPDGCMLLLYCQLESGNSARRSWANKRSKFSPTP